MKEFVKLTADQFRELIKSIPPLLAMLRYMNERLAKTPAAKFDSVMMGDFGQYSHLYEMSFIQHLSTVVVGFNTMDELKAWATSPDPQEAVLEDRYAKYATEHLAVAASRLRRVRDENVVELVTFTSRSNVKRA